MDLFKLLLALYQASGQNAEDIEIKEVGDKVVPGSENYLNYFIDVETDQQLTIECNHITDDLRDLFMSEPMVVVSNNLNKEFNCGHCTSIHVHDLIVFVPQVNRRYFTSSKDVKLIK